MRYITIESVCCIPRNNLTHCSMKDVPLCMDCNKPSGTFCGRGNCNMFGCACEHGCRTKPPSKPKRTNCAFPYILNILNPKLRKK